MTTTIYDTTNDMTFCSVPTRYVRINADPSPCPRPWTSSPRPRPRPRTSSPCPRPRPRVSSPWQQHWHTEVMHQTLGCILATAELLVSFWVTIYNCVHAGDRRSLSTDKRNIMLYYTYSVSQKKSPPEVFWHFFQNGREFLINFLHIYYTFPSMVDCKFLFNYLQLGRSYAILSATTQRIFYISLEL